MIKQPQTRRSPRGDCMRACISTLLEVPIAQVPDFMMMREDPDSQYSTEYLEMQHWLFQRGYTLVEITLKNFRWMKLPFTTLAIFKGKLASGSLHAIVGECEEGAFRPLYDPLNPSGNPAEAFADGKVESVCFLVAADPAKLRKNRTVEIINKSVHGDS